MADHTESIQIDYDPEKTTYRKLLKIFWESHNVTSHPWSRQYMSAIWYANNEQKKDIEKSMAKYQKKLTAQRRGNIATVVKKLGPFTLAEDYHQKWYLRKHAILMDALDCTDRELIDSHAATRLNAYVAGKGKIDTLNAEIDGFKLNDKAREYVTEMVKKQKGKGFFCSG